MDKKQALKDEQPLNFFDNEKDHFILDHGFVVPLHFILKENKKLNKKLRTYEENSEVDF